MAEKLYKTTVTIITSFNPELVSIETLAREADDGDGYCTDRKMEVVESDTVSDEVRQFFNIDPDTDFDYESEDDNENS